MIETPENNFEDAGSQRSGASMTASEVEIWFIREVLPLEAALTSFLQHNWRNKSDIADLRQEIYVRVCESAFNKIPDAAKAFVFRTARNLLINRVRREQVVPIEAITDLDSLGIATDAPGPDRTVIAREELHRLQAALDNLSPRCREAVVLGRVEGLSGREIAVRMGITEAGVSLHLDHGIRTLVNVLYGELPERGREP
ncbi:MAG TPA: RNA polymerase sigma factor [Rhizomicrobium sp.]